jgi:peptidyl-prolyl cis-trans isomerase C
MTMVLDRTVSPSKGKPVAVEVNGKVIPREAIAREIQYHPADNPTVAWQQAARALVVRELLLQEAARRGIAAAPRTDDAGRRETGEEALVRALVEREVATPEPDESECRRYYERNRSRFLSPDVYEAAHILFSAAPNDPAAYAKARAHAEAVIAELHRHPGRFGDLARAHSSCSSAAQDGNLGQISARQTTPEFEEALFALRPGEISAHPVPTRYGFHVIRLDRKIEGRQLPFELVAGRIAAYLRESVVRRAAAQFIARLVSGATIAGVALADAEAHRVH